MSDTTLTAGLLASALDLAKTVTDIARALASLRALLERRTGGRPLAGDDDVTLEV